LSPSCMVFDSKTDIANPRPPSRLRITEDPKRKAKKKKKNSHPSAKIKGRKKKKKTGDKGKETSGSTDHPHFHANDVEFLAFFR